MSWTAEPGALYTLVMTDLDAPCREEPTLKEVKHWVVGNIENGQLDRGETLVGYRGSRPPKNSGKNCFESNDRNQISLANL